MRKRAPAEVRIDLEAERRFLLWCFEKAHRCSGAFKIRYADAKTEGWSKEHVDRLVMASLSAGWLKTPQLTQGGKIVTITSTGLRQAREWEAEVEKRLVQRDRTYKLVRLILHPLCLLFSNVYGKIIAGVGTLLLGGLVEYLRRFGFELPFK